LQVMDVDIVDFDSDDFALTKNSMFFPSPDGKKIAVFYPKIICIFAADGDELGCQEFPERLASVDFHSVQWSPDSKMIVFTENFYRYMFEPDLWLLDVDAMSLNNLTDDGIEKEALGKQNALFDIFPQWIEDGKKIAFLRMLLEEEENVLCWMDPLRGEVEEAIKLPYKVIDGIAFSRDGKTYAFIIREKSNWSVYGGKLEYSTPELWFEADRPIFEVGFSADAKYLMIQEWLPEKLNFVAHLLDIASGEEVQTLEEVQDGGDMLLLTKFAWAPAGSAFLYFGRDLKSKELSLFAGKPGEEPRKIEVWDEYPRGLTTLDDDRWFSIPWCADNTLLLFNPAESELLRIYLAEE